MKKSIHIKYIVSVHDLEKLYHLELFLKQMGLCYQIENVYCPEPISRLIGKLITKNPSNKPALLRKFGNKCRFCGYSKSEKVLQFHKDGWLLYQCLGIERMAIVPSDIIVVCSNCHIELHRRD